MDLARGWNKALAGEAPGGAHGGADLLLGWEAPLTLRLCRSCKQYPQECGGLSPHMHLQSAGGQVSFLPANRCPSS